MNKPIESVGPLFIKPMRETVLFFRKKKSKCQHLDVANDVDAQLPDAPPEFIDTIKAVQPFTMTSPQRVLALCNAVHYILQNQIPGSFVECGVWRGGSMAAVARTLIQSGVNDRDLWLYDTFDGMSDPTEKDVDFLGKTASQLLQTEDPQDAKSVWCRSSIDDVQTVMDQTSYPGQRIKFVEGKVEETLLQHRPQRIALLRLDTDWYESTRLELEKLFPLMSPGGVLIIDDYGHWQGCRRAVDEYFQEHEIAMMLNRIDYTGRIGIYYPLDKKRRQENGDHLVDGNRFDWEAIDAI